MTEVRDLIITNESDPKKLPANYPSLLEPSVPLPITVQFYPLIRTWKDVSNKLIFGIILLLVGLVAGFITLKLWGFMDSINDGTRAGTTLFGQMISVPAVIAIVGIIGGIITLNSIRTTIQIVQARQAGNTYRFGLFVTPDAVLIKEEGDYVFLGKNRVLDVKKWTSGSSYLSYKKDKSETSTDSPQENTPTTVLNDNLTRANIPEKLENLTADSTFEMMQNWLNKT